MARFKIEATWDEIDGEPAVQLEYDRLVHISTAEFDQMVSDGMMRADDEPHVWQTLGTETVTDLPLLTPKRVRRWALHWLTEHAAMGSDDSFEFVLWQQAGREALERIEAAVGA